MANLTDISDSEIRCDGCGRGYPVVDGIPVLLEDPSQDCLLDLTEYDEQHPHDPSRSREFYSAYEAAFSRAGVSGGACVEIGSGTGNITHGIVNFSDFDEVHCSDISARFLVHLRDFIGPSDRMSYWIFDAAKLPFADGTINAVIGNSVLHHLLRYEDTIADVHRVLRPGGLAVFGEPVMEAHATVAYFLGVIVAMERKEPVADFTDKELERMHWISRQPAFLGKSKRENREALAEFEDKHLIGVQETLDLGYATGFSRVEYQNGFTAPEIGNSHRYELGCTLRIWGIDDSKLKPYDFLFEIYNETFGEAVGATAPVNYGYFKFQK